MSANNSEAIVLQVNVHISNINRLLKGVKSDVSVDLICSDNKEVIAATPLDLSIVKRYVKELNNINSNDVMSLWLTQSKLYLKILKVFYFLENINLSITFNIIKEVIKNTHIFNNIILVSCPYVIKTSPKLDITVIQVNIWDPQNGIKAKCFINRCFNIG